MLRGDAGDAKPSDALPAPWLVRLEMAARGSPFILALSDISIWFRPSDTSRTAFPPFARFTLPFEICMSNSGRLAAVGGIVSDAKQPCSGMPAVSLSSESSMSVVGACGRLSFRLEMTLGVGPAWDDFDEGSFRTRGRLPFFCNFSQCWSQQSTLSNFMCDGSSRLQSESGLDLFAI